MRTAGPDWCTLDKLDNNEDSVEVENHEGDRSPFLGESFSGVPLSSFQLLSNTNGRRIAGRSRTGKQYTQVTEALPSGLHHIALRAY